MLQVFVATRDALRPGEPGHDDLLMPEAERAKILPRRNKLNRTNQLFCQNYLKINIFLKKIFKK